MLKDKLPLFICEIANNHNGSVKKAKELIQFFSQIANKYNYNFAFKLQYRNIDTAIHESYRSADIPIIKRYINTALTWEEYAEIKKAIDDSGAISICTPFDEISVDKIVEHGYDIIKIPSCYFREWVLLEKIATTDLPIIASTGGWELPDIDDVVTFFEHRNKDFALMHCVAEYPMDWRNAQLDFIRVLKERYDIPIGFSSHERSDNDGLVGLAIAAGAEILERHIGFDEDNGYSARSKDIQEWFDDAQITYDAFGKRKISDNEKREMHKLYRGVYAKEKISAGEKLMPQKFWLALPCTDGQLAGHEISKYTDFYTVEQIGTNEPILRGNLLAENKFAKINKIVREVSTLIKKSGVIVPHQVELEISHHFGLDKFYEYGCVMITIVNREYCKKLIVLLPDQTMPTHYHKIKDETFHVLYGEITTTCGNQDVEQISQDFGVGEVIGIIPHMKHNIYSENGAVIEEISTKHFPDDSYYDEELMLERKTFVRWRFDA